MDHVVDCDAAAHRASEFACCAFRMYPLSSFISLSIKYPSPRHRSDPPRPHELALTPQNESGLVFPNTTLRQTLHLSLGGPSLRIRISNAFGNTDLSLTSAAVGLPTNGSAGVPSIVPGSSQKLTFRGDAGFVIPTGSYVVSDPVEMDVEPQSMLSVSMYLQSGQASPSNAVTSHPGSRTTSWFAFGDQLEVGNVTGGSLQSVAHWWACSFSFQCRALVASCCHFPGPSLSLTPSPSFNFHLESQFVSLTP